MALGSQGSSRKWKINHGSLGPDKLYVPSSWQKLKLLLWKNYKIQIRHNVQTLTEVLLPLLFTIVLVVVRNVVPSTFVPNATIYRPFTLENNPPIIIQLKCNRIYYTPKNTLVDSLMQKVNEHYFISQGLEYNFTGFETEPELVRDYIRSANFETVGNSSIDVEEITTPVLAGIIFKNDFENNTYPNKIEYTLRFPATQRSNYDIITERFGVKQAWYTELIYPLLQLLGPRSIRHLGGGLPGYEEEGFLYLQYAIDRTITRELLSPSSLVKYEKYDIKLQRFPYPAFIDDKYLFALQKWLPLIMLFSFIYPVTNITKSIVLEKENRLKEYMRIMGLQNWLIWIAWFIKSFLFLLVSVALMTLLLKTKLWPSQEFAVLPKSDATVILFIFVIFAFSLICFAFFMSTLFSHGATAAGVVWFVFYVPYGFLQPRYNLLSRFQKLCSCFLINTGIAFACQIICMFEGTGAGLQWDTIFQGSGPDDDFSIGDCLLMMIVNGLFYLISTIYMEAVRPGEFGVPTKASWGGKTKVSNHEGDYGESPEKNDFVEAVPGDMTPGVEIKRLTKIYDTGKVAVKNLSLNFYEGQITSFLGHNGAGKTSTLQVLSGIYAPDEGTAFINGHDIRTDLNLARSSLGLCLQQDIIFPELTVEEHLRFYGILKGVDTLHVDEEITRMIKSLGLESKRNAQSHTLSGGMKRKLSVGIAFVGGSRVILLDELSSGLDPGARRHIWDLIQSEKKNKTIILSTHYMEEADVLGDRIAIMAHGELQCCGSSLFLKKKYGGGYHLIIVKTDKCDVSKITKSLRRHIPDVEIDQNVGSELSYSLPDDKSHIFPELFEELENKKDELGIASYGASNTTMEEVFIRVGKQVEAKILAHHEESEEIKSNQSLKLNMNLNDAINDSQTHLYSDEPPRNVGITLKMQQFHAMLTKKLIYGLRNRKLLLAQISIPILYLILILIVLSNLPGISDPPNHKITLSKYEKLGRTVTPVRCPTEEAVCGAYKNFVSKDYLIENVAQNQSFVDFILEKENQDLVTVNFRYILGFDQRKVKENDTVYNQLVGFFVVFKFKLLFHRIMILIILRALNSNNQPLHTPPLSLNFITNSLLHGTNHSISVSNHPFPISSIDNLKQVGSLYTIGFQIGYNIAFGMSFLAASFSIFLIIERESRSKHIQFVSGVEFPLYWTASFFADFLQFMVAVFGVMGVLILFEIEDFLSFYMQMCLLLLFICYGLAVIPQIYVCSSFFKIPTSGFTRLVLFNIFTGMASMFTIVIIQIPQFHLQNVAELLNNIFLMFPNYALGMGIVQLSTNYQITRDCAKLSLEYFCSAYPNEVCCSQLKSNFLDWERAGIGKNIVFLLIGFLTYSTVLLVMESGIITKLIQKISQGSTNADNVGDLEDEVGILDSDVIAENHKINKSDLTSLCKSNTIVVKNLTKHYGDFLAVDHINLAVRPGECFGLLGINGAGKTTAFKMLTGDLQISEGEAYVYSRSVRNELKKVHEVLGYCPQFDSLIDEMTGRETIRMYARLRGIQETYIPRITSTLGEILLFSQYLDQRVGSYSGGNKRKLSTAIALIGSPPVIFLDEMTTGMDPVARRHIWNAVNLIRNSGISIILTTHSMDECEALCTRLAVMVNGKFRCLGSPQQLKNKFGKGYSLTLQVAPKEKTENEPFTQEKKESGRRRSSMMSMKKLTSPKKWELELEELRNYIEEAFPGSILKDIHPGFVHYQVPGQGVSSIFKEMEIAKQKFNLEAYSISQCSLEQIFLTFTKAQINAE